MSHLIREMQVSEADSVADLLVRSNEDNLAHFPREVADRYRAELADVRGRLAVATVLVAELDHLLAGTATLVRDATDDVHPWPPGGAVLRLLAVDPRARGSGLGQELSQECVDRARRSGAKFVGLHTAPQMESARALYERMGFRRAPEHDFEPQAHYGGSSPGTGERWGLAYVLEL